MKTSLRRILWVTAILAFGSVSSARADEPGAGPIRSAMGGCCESCSPCCQSSGGGPYFLAELIVARPHATENAFGGQPFDPNYGYRVTLGWAAEGGLGGRVRWLDFENTRPRGANRDGLDLLALDLEATLSPHICDRFHVLLVGGFRFSNAEFFSNANANNPTSRIRDAVGPTLGIEVGYDIGRGLGVFASGHTAFLFGDDIRQNARDSMFNWSEIQVGLQYARNMGGFTTFVRGGVEAHRFEGVPFDTQDIGLFGYFIGLGISR